MNELNITKISEELKNREPVFHHAELGVTREELEKQTATDFWEIGASGKKYDRNFVIDTVVERFEKGAEADTSQWNMTEIDCRDLGNNTFAFTYLLDQNGRLSRRLTLWRKTNAGWKILYHQGTLISEKVE